MIGRVWYGWTSREHADAYESLLRTTVLPGIHRVPGYHGAHLLRRDVPSGAEFVTVTWFASPDAVRTFAGPDDSAAVVSDAARALLDRYDERATHYALVQAPDGEGGTRTLVARFVRWLAFERDAHARTLASLDTVPEAARGDARFTQAVELLAHLAAARFAWLFRLGARATAPDTLLPRGGSIADAARALEDAHDAWAAWLATVDDAALARVATYRAYDGHAYRSQVEDVLTQLFAHSSYHRGQIAMLVRQLGGEPAITDFVFWSRERAEESS